MINPYLTDESRVLRKNDSSSHFNFQAPCYNLQLISINSDDYHFAKHFIESRYALIHQADISIDYPELIVALNASNEIMGAIGLRLAATSPLFLEKYFHSPIENEIHLHGSTYARESILEVGGFVSLNPKVSLELLHAVHAVAHSRSMQCMVVTATDAVRTILRSIGIEFNTLKKVCREDLSDSSTNWGNYYNHFPEVIYGDIQFNLEILGATIQSSGKRHE